MTRAIGYLRVSTQEQKDSGLSIAAQRAKVVAYAALYDIEVVSIITDEGVSAKTLVRPGLQQALGALEDGHAAALLVAKLDRLTRSVRDLGELVERYFSRFTLLSVGDHIDTRSAAGRLVLNILASVSQWEREAIGERTSAALRVLQSQGVRLGRKPMRLGCENTVLTLISDLYASGSYSHVALAHELNRRGICTSTGEGRWHGGTVAKALKLATTERTEVSITGNPAFEADLAGE